MPASRYDSLPLTLCAFYHRNSWKGSVLFTLSLGLTLCAPAVAESTGEASAPAWFLGFAIPVLTEWVREWVVWGRRKTAGD